MLDSVTGNMEANIGDLSARSQNDAPESVQGDATMQPGGGDASPPYNSLLKFLQSLLVISAKILKAAILRLILQPLVFLLKKLIAAIMHLHKNHYYGLPQLLRNLTITFVKLFKTTKTNLTIEAQKFLVWAKPHYDQSHLWFKTHIVPRTEKYFTHLIAWAKTFNKNDPEVEFYPAALEVLETPPSPAGRAIAGIIIAFIVIALLWACIGSVDIIATAQGKIVPTGRTKVIQPLEAGVVRKIHVQDGQTVKAGDVMIEIDSTINEAERDRLRKEYVDTELDVAHLKAVLSTSPNPLDSFDPPEASPDQIATQKSLITNQVDEIRDKLAGLDSQIAQNEGNRAAVTATIDKLTKSIPMLEERAKMREALSDKGYGSKIDTLNAQQDLIEHQQDLIVQQGRLAEASGQLESLREQRKQAEAEFQHTNLDKLTEAEQKATSLHEQLLQAAQKYRLQTLKSPVDGTVQQLAVHTEGGVVTPAEALLQIVPADSHIEIEAMISNKDIGFVHTGQEAEVKVDTFNFTRYGLIHGHVVSVSHDAIMREKPLDKQSEKQQVGTESDTSEPNGQELVYSARIALDKTQMDIDGKMMNLEPGMAVTAEIKTGKRHIISYILSPVIKHAHQAFREQ